MDSNLITPCGQKDLFGLPGAGLTRLVLTIKKIQAPRTLAQKKRAKEGREIKVNFHIPSFKNAKHWITHDPKGNPLERPFLITSPEFQRWMEKAAALIESQLLSLCQTASGVIPVEQSKLYATCWLLPADDSCSDLPEGHWKVVRVPPGEEGAEIVIERLS